MAQQAAAQAAQQVAHLLDQVFAALKESLVLAIQHGMLVVLFFCGGAFIAAIFLKDVPLKKSWGERKPEDGAGGETEEQTVAAPIH